MLNSLKKFNPFKSATEVAERMRLSSIVTPLLWIIFIIGCILVFSLKVNNKIVTYITLGFLIILVITFVCIYLHILNKDPSLLRSEDHIFLMSALQFLGDEKTKLTNPNESPIKNNPALPAPATNDIPVIKDNLKQPEV